LEEGGLAFPLLLLNRESDKAGEFLSQSGGSNRWGGGAEIRGGAGRYVMSVKYLDRSYMNRSDRTLETNRKGKFDGWRDVECSSEEGLIEDYRWGMAGKKPPAGLILGWKKNQFLTESRTVVTGENTNKKIHHLMDNLYDIYRKDRHAEAGMNQMPWIGTLRAHQSSEFHIYATEGVW
jgi:hypothetical protein